jgi:hypothetical protein
MAALGAEWVWLKDELRNGLLVVLTMPPCERAKRCESTKRGASLRAFSFANSEGQSRLARVRFEQIRVNDLRDDANPPGKRGFFDQNTRV